MEHEQHPANYFKELSRKNGLAIFSKEFAKALDADDKLSGYRNRFHYPAVKDLPKGDTMETMDRRADSVYLCGQSLGLQPKRLAGDMQRLLNSWSQYGVHGHFHGEMPWATIDESAQRPVAELVGALPHEVAVMNGLTVNLHLLLVSFYQPTNERYKILFEAKAFPSDKYVFESQVRLQGYHPKDALVEMTPREGEECLRREDIMDMIREHGHEIQVICFPGVQYYTGQLFDIPGITKAGQEAGCYVGWDLAHAVCNVELALHDWNVDFAVWCHYKYMCSGAGATGGAFLHQRHASSNLPRLQGWWSHELASRFAMDNVMISAPGIAGYRLSNPSIFASLPVKVGAELILEAGMHNLAKKSRLLTGYLEYLLDHELNGKDGSSLVTIITPRNLAERGAQLSIQVKSDLRRTMEELQKRGVVCDHRMPAVLRLGPKPIYNSFTDIYRFVSYLKDSMQAIQP